jgi:diguanylate cyclase (GGDEF)-like protein
LTDKRRERRSRARQTRPSPETVGKLLEIESSGRLTSTSIGTLGDRPDLLKEYLEASIANTFSELLFRLTHETYAEEKALDLWNRIVAHRADLHTRLGRDVGMLVAALDYLSNVSGDLSNPKIIDDLRIEQAATMATRDALTGLYLRGVFDFSIDRLVQEHLRFEKPLSLLMIDIDDFKRVNDELGHHVGDEVLRRVGRTILSSVRSADFPARYGGEELVVVFPETELADAFALADRLRTEIHDHTASAGPAVTVSMGVSALRNPDVVSTTDLLWRADKALYAAKGAGKNLVERAF